ncbi:hypothetical protein B296_00057518, partial [Ensete ventricosum]
TAEIDHRRPILVLPPGSDRSAYRSAAGPVYGGGDGGPKGAEDLVEEGEGGRWKRGMGAEAVGGGTWTASSFLLRFP